MSASNMTDLRARLREQGIEYRVIKNTLTLLAASELGREGVDRVLQGPTAMAFGYGDVTTVAKGINTYIATTRLPLVINGAVMDGQILTAGQVVDLALLPPRDELLARLLGQMQAPITGLVTVLSAPLRGLVTVLQRVSEQGGNGPAVAVADLPAAEVADTAEDAAADEEPAPEAAGDTEDPATDDEPAAEAAGDTEDPAADEEPDAEAAGDPEADGTD
jgi:large subunit ribosomal protein L10